MNKVFIGGFVITPLALFFVNRFIIEVPHVNYVAIALGVTVLILGVIDYYRKAEVRKERKIINKLSEVCKKGDLEELKKEMEFANPEQVVKMTEYGGNNLLMFAATYGHVQIFKYLLEYGFDPNSANKAGETVLLRACHFNKKEIVKVLLERDDVDLEKRSRNGWSALITCILRNKLEIAEMLLNRGTKIDLESKNPQILGIIKSQLTPEMNALLTTFEKWRRIRNILYLHSKRDEIKDLPKAYYISSDIFRRFITEYF